MPEELVQMLKEWHTVPVATTGPDGKPNVAGKSVMVMDPETIVWWELILCKPMKILKKILVHQSVSGKEILLSGHIG
jgi:hypothetical protein